MNYGWEEKPLYNPIVSKTNVMTQYQGLYQDILNFKEVVDKVGEIQTKLNQNCIIR